MENNADSVQNRFTAYLMIAITNKRTRYLQKKSLYLQQENMLADLDEKVLCDFAQQYHNYQIEREGYLYKEWKEIQVLLSILEESLLKKAIKKLKDRDKQILCARVFGELEFAKIGVLVGLSRRQTEMVYYYILRKLKKELEDRYG